MGLRESQREHTITLIVGAAAEVFGRNGYHATSMEEVARETGCATATLYGYFSSKEALFSRVLMDLIGSYLDGVRQAVESSEGFEGGVHAYFDHFLDFSERKQEVIRVVHGALRSAQAGAQPAAEQIRALAMAYYQGLAPLFDRAVAEGSLPAGRETQPLFTLLIGVLHAPIDAWLDTGADLHLGVSVARALFLAGFPAAVAALPPGASS